ncbi:hypothetical protein ACNKHK_26660 [Shigella flexneri]
MNTADAKRLGIQDEELVWVNSRKGRSLPVRSQPLSKQRRDLHDLPVVDWRM